MLASDRLLPRFEAGLTLRFEAGWGGGPGGGDAAATRIGQRDLRSSVSRIRRHRNPLNDIAHQQFPV